MAALNFTKNAQQFLKEQEQTGESDSKLISSKKKTIKFRHAPVEHERPGDNSKFLERQKQAQASHQEKEIERTQLTEKAAIQDAKYQNIRANNSYQRRIRKEKARKFYNLRRESKQQTPLTSTETNMSLITRVKAHNRHHYCSCTLSRTTEEVVGRPITVTESRKYKCNTVRAVREGEGFKYIFGCHHRNATLITRNVLPCKNCGCKITIQYKSPCNCEYTFCSRCHFSTFYTNHGYQFHDIHTSGITVTYREVSMVGKLDQKTYLQDSISLKNEELKKKEVVQSVNENTNAWQKPVSTNSEQNVLNISDFPALESKDTLTVKKEETSKPESKNSIRKKKRYHRFNNNLPQFYSEDVIETKPEGASMSSVANSGMGMMKSVTAPFLKGLQNLQSGLSETTKDMSSKLLTLGVEKSKYGPLVKFFKALRHFVAVVLDYGDVTFIYNLYTFVTELLEKNFIKATIAGGSLINLAIIQEQSSRHKYRRLLERGKNPFKEDFGSLTTIYRSALMEVGLDETDDYTRAIIQDEAIKIIKTGGLSGWMNLEEAADGFSITSFFTGMCECLPKYFKSALPVLSQFAKVILPVLSVANIGANLFKHLKGAFKSMASWFTNKYLDDKDWYKAEMQDEESPIHKLHVSFLAYKVALKESTYDVAELRQKVYENITMAETYLSEQKKFTPNILSIVRYYKSNLDQTGAPKMREFEPTVLCLEGPPGTGKSTLWPAIIAPITKYKSLSELRADTYTWNQSSEYQTGLTGKKIVLFDDLGQDKSSSTEALNIISLVTTAPYPINSANITGPEIKGDFAYPEALVVCTNDRDLGSGLLRDSEAIKRRMDLWVKVDRTYNEGFPTKPFAKILRARNFSNYEGKCVNMSTLRTLFAIIHMEKRKKFTETADMVNNLVESKISMTLDMNDEVDPELLKRYTTLCDGEESVKELREKEPYRFFDPCEYCHRSHGKDECLLPQCESCHKRIGCERGGCFRTFNEKKLIEEIGNAASYLDHLDTNDRPDETDLAIKKSAYERLAVLRLRYQYLVEERKKQEEAETKRKGNDILQKLEAAFLKKEMEILKKEQETKKEETKKNPTVQTEEATIITKDESLIPTLYNGISEFVRVSKSAIVGAIGVSAIAFHVDFLYETMMFYNNSTSVSRYLWNIGKYIGAFVIATFSIRAIYKTMTSSNDQEESGTTKTAKFKTAKTIMTTGESSNGMENILQVIKKATGTIRVGPQNIVNCIFIGGTYVLTVKHIFNSVFSQDNLVPEGTPISIIKSSWNTGPREIKFERKRLHLFPGPPNLFNGKEIREDVCVYQLDNKLFNNERQIWHHFWDASTSINNVPVVRVDYMTPYFEKVEESVFHLDSGVVLNDQKYTPRNMTGDIYYHMVAVASYKPRMGSCGTAVLSTISDQKPILGIHNASNTQGQSTFCFVTSKMLERIVCASEMPTIEEGKVCDIDVGFKESEFTSVEFLPERSNLELVGFVDVKLFQPTKTDLSQSAVHGALGPVKTVPSVLTHRDERMPEEYRTKAAFDKMLFKGFEYNGKDFCREDLEQAVVSILEEHRAWWKQSRVPQRKLTLEEALNGIGYIKESSRIDLTTSAGYPFASKGIKRTDLVYEVDGVLKPTEKLTEMVAKADMKLQAGIVPFLPMSLTLKDERVKIKKVFQVPKTRLFANANFIHFLISRMYFYPYLMMHRTASRPTYSTVGLDRISVDWDQMILELAEVGSHGFDLDGEYWDKRLRLMLTTYGTQIMLSHLNLTPRNREAVIVFNTQYYYIYENMVFKALGTISSGKLTTFELNNLVNEIAHRAGYFALARKQAPGFATYLSYKKYNRTKFGGDDSIHTVAPEISKWYNGETYAKWANERGFYLTDPNKEDGVQPLKPLCSMSFLKNTTGYMNGLYVPLADYDSLIEMTNYVRLGKYNPDVIKATSDNVNAALRGFFFYGPEKYNEIRERCLEVEPRLTLLSYIENLGIWKTYNYFPGAHADYATLNDQDDTVGIIPTHKRQSYRRHPTDQEEMDQRIEITTEQANTGEDTAQLGLAQHPQDAPTTIIKTMDAPTAPNTEISTDKVNTHAVGTNIQESNPVITGTLTQGKIMGNSINMRAEAHCNDINWDLRKFEEKYTTLRNIQWTLADAVGSVIDYYNIPTDVLITPALKLPFDATAFWRATKVSIRVQVKASPFYSGALVVGFVPTMAVVPQSGNDVTLGQLIQLGGKIIKASDNQTVEFDIPYKHYLGFLEVPEDGLGQFVIMVLNPLRTGTGAENNVTVTTFVRIADSEFKVPEYIPNASYNSHKFGSKIIYTIPESGESKTTEISHISNGGINDTTFDAVNLCAGTGIVTEPKVTQFQDHPLDLTVLMKRYVKLTPIEFEVEAGQRYEFAVPFQSFIQAQPFANLYYMYRGSFNIKIMIIAIDENGNRTPYVGHVCVVNTSSVSDALDLQPLKKIEDGLSKTSMHYFDDVTPAEFIVPYLNTTFATTMYSLDGNFPMRTPYTFVVVTIDNIVPRKVNYVANIYVAASDDISMGVFKGIKENTTSKIIHTTPESKEGDYSYFQESNPILINYTKKENGSLVRISNNELRAMGFLPPVPTALTIHEIEEKIKEGKRTSTAQDKRLLKHYLREGFPTDPELYEMSQNLREMYKYDKEIITLMTVETTSEGIGEFMDKVLDTTLPIIDAVDAIGSILDAHPITENPSPMKIRPFGYLGSCDNPEYMERMMVTNHNGMSVADKETYYSTKRETLIYPMITGVKTLVDQIEWSTGDNTGTLLKTYAVGPRWFNGYKGAKSPMDYLAQFFTFWNGGVQFIFDVTASQMHHGQLTITYHPNLTEETKPTTLNTANQQYWTSFDLANGRGFKAVNARYLSKYSTRPIALDSEQPYNNKHFYNGIICLWVSNTLRGTTTVDSKVDINIYVKGCEDFKLFAYGNSNMNQVVKAKKNIRK